MTNGSAEDQTVSATATGPAGWTVQTKLAQANAASTIVKAGSTTTITVTATPPDGAPAGHTDIDVDGHGRLQDDPRQARDRHHRDVHADARHAERPRLGARRGRRRDDPGRSS